MKGATDLALNKNNIIAYSKSYELTDDIKIKGVNVLDQNSLNKIIVSRKEPITGRLFPAKSGQLTNIDADKYLFSLKTVRQPLNLKIGKAGTVLAQKSRVINIFPPAIADAGLKFTQRGGSLMGLTIIPLISGNVAGGPIQVTQDKQIIKENHINAVPAPEIKTFRNLNLAPISTIKPETPNKLIPLGLEIGIKTNLKRGIIPQMNTRISERITTKFTPPPPQINITPPPPTPIVPPSNFLGTIKPGKTKGSKSGGFSNLLGKYSPSLTAVLFNIKSTKTPRYTSGLAIQPIKIKI